MGYSIEIKNLTKKYGSQTVLNNVSLHFTDTHIYGLVGRNGSGKTMLFKHICGFVKPDSGSVSVNGKVIGKDIENPDNCGIIIESPGFLPEYTGYQNLQMLAVIKKKIGKEQIRQAMCTVGLDPDLKKAVGKYSLGMRQRLGIAQAIMEDPGILLLDEPMNGLDNEGVGEMRKLLLSLRNEGRLILIASHTKEDIDILCDEVYHMDHGTVTSVDYQKSP